MGGKLQVEKFKNMLLDERKRLEKERHARLAEEMEVGVELADYDSHPADAASETYERTMNYAIEENFREIIERVDEALRKIDLGTYGLCDRCGEPINPERLKAIPYATLCIECQGTVERR